MVRNPASNHAAISQPGAPSNLEISALTIKIPDPIIDPATIAVESKRLRLLLNVCSWFMGQFGMRKLIVFNVLIPTLPAGREEVRIE